MYTFKQTKPTSSMLKDHQVRFLREHHICPMCEEDLEITHNINKKTQKVKEAADCPNCEVRARALEFDLH